MFCDNPQSFGSRPKIWSLARTATSNSPPLIRRYPGSTDYCLDGVGQKEDSADCAKMKTGYSCSMPYPNYERTSGVQPPAEDLCCDSGRTPMYGSVLPSCSVPTKCESTDCLVPPTERNSCMVNSQCSYATDYPNGAEHYGYSEKPYKSKDLCAIEYPSTKCQSLDGQEPKKLSQTIMPYPGSDPGARTDYYAPGNRFEQTQGTMGGLQHKSTPNQSGIEIASDSVTLLRRSDH